MRICVLHGGEHGSEGGARSVSILYGYAPFLSNLFFSFWLILLRYIDQVPLPLDVLMSVYILNLSEVDNELRKLRTLLQDLPRALPHGNQRYNFDHFSPDPEKTEDFGGEDCAVNHALEITFCPGGRRNGPILLQEQGPGLVAIVNVLHKYIHAYPSSAVLQKWIFDLMDGAKYLGAVSLIQCTKVCTEY